MRIFLIALVILLFSTSSVLSFGISSPYWKTHPLEMYPGQTKEVSFNLQNCPSLREDCDQEDVNVIAVFEEGSEIAEIISGDSYLVPFGSANTNIILKVTIPESASVGDSYNIKFSVSAPPAEEEGGNVQLGVGYGVKFPVNVVEKPAEPAEPEQPPETEGINGTTIAIVVIVILVVIFLVFWLLKKKR